MKENKDCDLNIEELEKAAAMLKAMAHPMRVAILNLLKDGKKMTVSEIHQILGIEQSAASHHLGILKNKTVLKSERKGKNSYYFFKNKTLEKLIHCINRCSEKEDTK
ncbi:MAG: transcriptional regulator [Bacteroidia bacterium]|nr:MAG: transcriptional regulator [Bacteroidia bacterium]